MYSMELGINRPFCSVASAAGELLKLTTDGHKASCGLSATAKLLVSKLGKMTDVDNVINRQHFKIELADIHIQIWINPAIWTGIPDHFRLKFWRWRRFALSEHSLTVNELRYVYIQIVEARGQEGSGGQAMLFDPCTFSCIN